MSLDKFVDIGILYLGIKLPKYVEWVGRETDGRWHPICRNLITLDHNLLEALNPGTFCDENIQNFVFSV